MSWLHGRRALVDHSSSTSERGFDLAATPDVEEVVARVRERKVATGTRLTARKILAHRDRDRR